MPQADRGWESGGAWIQRKTVQLVPLERGLFRDNAARPHVQPHRLANVESADDFGVVVFERDSAAHRCPRVSPP